MATLSALVLSPGCTASHLLLGNHIGSEGLSRMPLEAHPLANRTRIGRRQELHHRVLLIRRCKHHCLRLDPSHLGRFEVAEEKGAPIGECLSWHEIDEPAHHCPRLLLPNVHLLYIQLLSLGMPLR